MRSRRIRCCSRGGGAFLLRCTDGGRSAEPFLIGIRSPHDYSYQNSDEYINIDSDMVMDKLSAGQQMIFNGGGRVSMSGSE